MRVAMAQSYFLRLIEKRKLKKWWRRAGACVDYRQPPSGFIVTLFVSSYYYCFLVYLRFVDHIESGESKRSTPHFATGENR